jgi:xanthine/CO dehydrogenase XdhC/CoxF family maturation factor
MHDFANIVSEWERRPRECYALVTVVRTRGSTYRKPGARMLVSKDGETTGMVSGGCLEKELAQHGKAVIRSLKPSLVSYDTRRLLGCHGVLDLLIEPILPLDGEGLFSTVHDCLARRISLVTSTLFHADGLLEDWLGSYPLVAEDGTRFGAKELPEPIGVDGRSVLRAGPAIERHYELEGASASVLLHNVAPPPRLYICGAGPDVVPLASFASQLKWEVIVARHASEAAPDLPPGCKLVTAGAEELAAEICPDARTACVIMTHQFGRDLAWLSALLPLKLPYVGLLGPTARRQQLLNHVMDTPRDLFDWAMFDSLHGPAGLDLGADGPEEIALSIVSEIKAVLAGRPGGSLRDRATARAQRCDLTLVN